MKKNKFSKHYLLIGGVAILCCSLSSAFAFDFDDFLDGASDISKDLQSEDRQTSNENKRAQQQLNNIQAQDKSYYSNSKINSLRTQADEADRLKREREEFLASERRRKEEERKQAIAAANEQRFREEQKKRELAIIRGQQQITKNQVQADKNRREEAAHLSQLQRTRIAQEKKKQAQLAKIHRKQEQQQTRTQQRPQRQAVSCKGKVNTYTADDYLVEIVNNCSVSIEYRICVRTNDQWNSADRFRGRIPAKSNSLLPVGNSVFGHAWKHGGITVAWGDTSAAVPRCPGPF